MKYEFIGWCHEGIHDKIWGVMPLRESAVVFGGSYLIFWGRRGRKLQTKIIEDAAWGINDKILSKKERGYIEVDPDKLDELYPEFKSDLSKTAMWALLKV